MIDQLKVRAVSDIVCLEHVNLLLLLRDPRTWLSLVRCILFGLNETSEHEFGMIISVFKSDLEPKLVMKSGEYMF